jgi:UPF0755 protein
MRKIFRYSVFVLFLLGMVLAFFAFQWIWAPNIPDNLNEKILVIPSNSNFEDVVDLLEQGEFIKNKTSFIWLSKKMNYAKEKVPSGKFKIRGGMSNRDLIRKLRAGYQEPVSITFNQARTSAELAGQISKYIESDSLEILQALTDSTLLAKYGYTPENIISMFIPNTYEVYWNISIENLMDRMQKEHDLFWSKKDRLEKAADLALSTHEVYILASIVEKESLLNDEKPIIAGVYLNRLKKGMLLQADPTVVYATGDFGIQRVLNKHLAIDSPYNTYKYVGLPPGPICMPTITSIDGVLNAEDHNYIFFCAKPESGGRHAFASTLSGHNRNATEYRNWLQANRIK